MTREKMKNPDSHTLPSTSFRFSAEAREMLDWLAERDGVSRRDVLEKLIREEWRWARGEGK